ncbi:MAG TPA: hypothetical protein VK653_04605 [Xanthobacteraceae bacterium]|nr:hypothetical protein [Xanthobacteraceae bacterium]
MAYSKQRLLLRALLKGLGDAVRRNDGSAADRYRRRISLTAGHFETNPRVSEALEQLLSASGRWSATKVAERYEAEQPVHELIERIMEFL